MEVTLLVSEGACKYEEKREAQSYGVTIVDAKKRPGYDPLEWLSVPPKELSMDVVVSHGLKLGRQVQIIRVSDQFRKCKWVQVVRTDPEDLKVNGSMRFKLTSVNSLILLCLLDSD